MSKYQVPEGEINAVIEMWGARDPMLTLGQFRAILCAAKQWQAENPIVPTDEQTVTLREAYEDKPIFSDSIRAVAVEWQRMMHLVPAPKVPSAIKDLLWDEEIDEAASPRWKINEGIIEAYRRGKAERNG